MGEFHPSLSGQSRHPQTPLFVSQQWLGFEGKVRDCDQHQDRYYLYRPLGEIANATALCSSKKQRKNKMTTETPERNRDSVLQTNVLESWTAFMNSQHNYAGGLH